MPRQSKTDLATRQDLKQLGQAINTRLESRFEKQEVMFEQRFQNMSEQLTGYFDQRFQQVSDELKTHMEVLVENIRAEVGEPYQDKLELVDSKVDNHEQRSTA